MGIVRTELVGLGCSEAPPARVVRYGRQLERFTHLRTADFFDGEATCPFVTHLGQFVHTADPDTSMVSGSHRDGSESEPQSDFTVPAHPLAARL